MPAVDWNNIDIFEPIPFGIAGYRYGFSDFERALIRVPKLIDDDGHDQPNMTGFGNNAECHQITVDVSGHKFLVVGYVIPPGDIAPTNPILESISPSTKFRGEVMAFAKGVRTDFLRSPANVPKALWTEAVGAFVSGVMSALDRGRAPPIALTVQF